MYNNGNNRVLRPIRMIIDILNVIIGGAAVVFAVMVFINTSKNMWMFPVIFILGAAMNFITGIKYFITDRKISGIIFEVAAVFLLVVCIVSRTAIGG